MPCVALLFIAEPDEVTIHLALPLTAESTAC
jgi:hypothetical protein